MKRLLYLILKKDMIRRLRSKKYGSQLIDDVMEAFDMPTDFTIRYRHPKNEVPAPKG